uniref:Uncharacterized protein n=1 Tax=uncultured Flavobacteriia bacterium TaxID=212695 RepID=H6RG16_9BACT|nr:hypothetical protein VIS_S3CFB50005 [uncultured Flavobacteriia bacterium]
MNNKFMFIIGLTIFTFYVYFYIRIVVFGSSNKKRKKED